MARPSPNSISHGEESWDADIETNFGLIFDTPIPIAVYSSASALPSASSYENCLAITQDTDQLYMSDGSSWNQISAGAFTDLSDTPSSYTGNAGKLVAVNSAANALEFIDNSATVVFSKVLGRFLEISSTEKDTGMRWTDNSQIYCKYVDHGTLQNNGTDTASHGISNLGDVIEGWAVICSTNFTSAGTFQRAPGAAGTASTDTTAVYIDSSSSRINTRWNASSYYGRAYYLYTKSSGGGTTETEGAITHSSTEQTTGWSWLDGRQIYCKTIDTGGMPNATTKTVAHGISDFGELIFMAAVSDNGTTQMIQPRHAVDANVWKVDSTNITITTTSDRSGYTASHCTLYYTKDEYKGGNAASRGPNYSIEEQKAGFTWGASDEEVYFKVIDTGTLPNATSKTVYHSIQRFKNLIMLSGCAYDGTYYHPMPVTTGDTTNSLTVTVDEEKIDLDTSINLSTFTSSYVILYYTKKPKDFDSLDPRKVIHVDTDIYVATTGSDETGDGTSSTPWASLSYAIKRLQEFAIHGDASVTIHIADGTYTETTSVCLNHPNGDRIKIKGTSSTPTGYSVTGGNQGSKQFTVSGDQTSSFPTGSRMVVQGSTLNDSVYSVASSSYSGGTTTITVSESIQSSTFDGTIYDLPQASAVKISASSGGQVIGLSSGHSIGEFTGICILPTSSQTGLLLDKNATMYSTYCFIEGGNPCIQINSSSVLKCLGIIAHAGDYSNIYVLENSLLYSESYASSKSFFYTCNAQSGRGIHGSNRSSVRLSSDSGARPCACHNSDRGINLEVSSSGAMDYLRCIGNGGDGIVAYIGTSIQVNNAISRYNSGLGVCATEGSVIYASSATASNNGSDGFRCGGTSYLYADSCTADNNTSIGVYAFWNAYLRVGTPTSITGNGTNYSPSKGTVGNEESYIN